MRNTNILYHMLQDIIQENVEGQRGPGRSITYWLANLRKWFRILSIELFRAATDREWIAMLTASIQNGSDKRIRILCPYNTINRTIYSHKLNKCIIF